MGLAQPFGGIRARALGLERHRIEQAGVHLVLHQTHALEVAGQRLEFPKNPHSATPGSQGAFAGAVLHHHGPAARLAHDVGAAHGPGFHQVDKGVVIDGVCSEGHLSYLAVSQSLFGEPNTNKMASNRLSIRHFTQHNCLLGLVHRLVIEALDAALRLVSVRALILHRASMIELIWHLAAVANRTRDHKELPRQCDRCGGQGGGS